MGLWDEYQDFSTKAKPHGGANAYLDLLENNAKEEGNEKGRIEGGLIVGGGLLFVAGAVYGGKWVYRKVKNYIIKRKNRKQLSSEVRQEFLDNVEQFEKNENKQTNDER